MRSLNRREKSSCRRHVSRIERFIRQLSRYIRLCKRFLKVLKSVPKGGAGEVGARKRTRVGLPPSPSSVSGVLLPPIFFSRSVPFPPLRRDPRPLTRHAKRLTYARERACSREKEKKEEGKKENRRRRKGGGGERKKCGQSRHELLLVEKLEVFARCVSKQFCLLIGGVKGRKATPPLRAFVIIDERFYSRALFAGCRN